MNERGGSDVLNRPTIDFDHHSQNYGENFFEVYRDLRTNAPVAWTESHGGFWVISRHEDVLFAAQHGELFSSFNDVTRQTPFGGIGIPPVSGIQILPQEMDPPEVLKWRGILHPIFSPRAVEELRPMITNMVQWAIDQQIERGEAEFVGDIAAPLVAYIAMKWLGLPAEQWGSNLTVLTQISHTSQHDPHYAEIMAALNDSVEGFRSVVRARRSQPTDDVISYLAGAQIDGELIPEDRLVGLLFSLMTAAGDTTTQLLSVSTVYLGEHPDERERVRHDPALLASACEELLRFYTIAMISARTVTAAVELGGQQLRAGDRVLLSFLSANHDDKVFSEPDAVVLDRTPNPHAGFGLGAHRCLGSHFARATFATFFQHALVRLGDYELVAADVKASPFVPFHFGYERVPIRFTPGARVGAPEPVD
jgi:cytochrome P450